MNQKLSDWASIAEIVSGIAVVITIVFLVVGIRGNTEITRAAVYDRNIDSLNAWRLSVAQDEDLLRVWTAYLQDDTEGFTGEDHRRMDLILSALWGIYEKSYYSNQYGILGSSEWSRFEARLCPNSTESEELWQEVVARLLTEEFVNFVRTLCSDEP